MKETLLNGDHENYNMDYGYTLHMINDSCSEGITGEIYACKYCIYALYLFKRHAHIIQRLICMI